MVSNLYSVFYHLVGGWVPDMNRGKVTFDEFRNRSVKKFGDIFDFNINEFKNMTSNIHIRCTVCGVVMNRPPNGHIKSSGCKECFKKIHINRLKENRKNNFINYSKNKHKNTDGSTKFDYSLVEYVTAEINVSIICPIHGKFRITPTHHKNSDYGCQRCGLEARRGTNRLTLDEFIIKAQNKHKNTDGSPIYDYSKVEYINNKTEVCIICPEHGEFWQRPDGHLHGAICWLCGINKRAINKINKHKKKYIDEVSKIHVNSDGTPKYDYSKFIYIGCNVKGCIICPDHGEFWQLPSSHKDSMHGCPVCSESHGERETAKWLFDHKVEFSRQYQYDDLIGSSGWRKLSFDFYLPKHNILIEYDGQQHYEWINGMMSKQEFLNITEHDRRKTEYCDKHGIHLIRIRYDEDVGGVLESELVQI